jgi:hypothetical protein
LPIKEEQIRGKKDKIRKTADDWVSKGCRNIQSGTAEKFNSFYHMNFQKSINYTNLWIRNSAKKKPKQKINPQMKAFAT